MVLPLFLVVASAPQDTVVAEANTAPSWGDVRLEEQFRIGTLSGAPEQVLGNVAAVALGEDGSLSILDTQGPIVLRYSASGAYLGTVGREGGGPGEYRSPLDVEPLGGNLIALWDPASLRVTVFGPSFERDIRVEAPAVFTFVDDVFEAARDGRFFVKTPSRGPLDHRAHGRREGVLEYDWLEIGPTGEILDTIPAPAEESSATYTLITPEGAREPFPTKTVSVMSPCGYMVAARTDRYALFRRLDDVRVLQIERPHDPVPIGRGERQYWEAINDRFAGQAASMGRAFERPRIPRHKPPLRGLFVDSDCRIWVSVYGEGVEVASETEKGPASRWREPPRWEVFDERGRFLGRVDLPLRTRLKAARGNTLVAVKWGEFDEQYVVVYRIRTD